MTVKEITVQGCGYSLTEAMGSKRRRGGSVKRRGGMTGGDGGGAMAQMAAGSVPAVAISKIAGSTVAEASGPAPLDKFALPLRQLGGSANAAVSAANPVNTNPVTANASPASQQPAQQSLQGGAKAIRVELKKSATQKKVHLNPKKDGHVQVHKKAEKTKKNRHITLGLAGLHKRLTRAKRIHHKVKEMPLAELKAELIKRGLVKESTKAPESVLRQIAADAQIVSGRAL